SEPLFGLLLVAAVILADRPPPRLASGSAALLAGHAAALALLTRALGVAAGACVVAWLYAARRGSVAQARPDPSRQATLASLPLVAAGAGWAAWSLTQAHALGPLLAPDSVSGLAAALVAGYVRYETRGFAGRWWELSARRISDTFAEVLPTLDSLPPDAVIASDHDPLVWLYTRRVAVPLYISSYWGAHVIEPPPPVHRAYLERQGVTHVLLAGNQADGKEELERLLATYPGWLGIVRRWPDGATIFVVHRAR